MKHKLEVIYYTLAAMSSVCLVSGLLLLSGGDSKHVEDRRVDICD
jgi:hypothetical protein